MWSAIVHKPWFIYSEIIFSSACKTVEPHVQSLCMFCLSDRLRRGHIVHAAKRVGQPDHGCSNAPPGEGNIDPLQSEDMQCQWRRKWASFSTSSCKSTYETNLQCPPNCDILGTKQNAEIKRGSFTVEQGLGEDTRFQFIILDLSSQSSNTQTAPKWPSQFDSCVPQNFGGLHFL